MAESTPMQEKEIAKSDWLGFDAAFYNVRTGRCSPNFNDLVGPEDLEFHPEGLINYLEFGYSVLGQTPLRNIRFVQANNRLVSAGGALRELPGADPASDLLAGPESSEEAVKSALRESIAGWEAASDGPIVVPTSGGFDSRLLNLLVRDRSRIRAFTYGISRRQTDSREVVYARELARKLGVAWEAIPLRDIHAYFEDWNELFGASTHAHGMYHIEFYSKIAKKVPPGARLLSGIVGDVWAGSVAPAKPGSPNDLHLLGYTHGLNADSSQCLLPRRFELRERFFEENRERLDSERWRVLFLIRFKMILLRYLLKVPASLGFTSWSPFLEISPSIGMLMLPGHRRAGRQWQRDWFAGEGVLFEEMPIRASGQNTLDADALRARPPGPLDERLLSGIIRPDYVRWINSQVSSPGLLAQLRTLALGLPRVGGVLKRFGATDAQARAYGAYLTLKPFDTLLRKHGAGGAAA